MIVRAVCTAVLACAPVLAAGADRTNVLLIVADDLGYNDLAINSASPRTHTPSLDALARQGVRFTQHYAESVCSPARAALLTGMHPARLGYVPNGRGLSPQLVTLAEALGGAGYRTMHIGKWHIGDTLREAWPDRQGFEHWFGFLNQWHLSGHREGGQLVPGEERHMDPWLMRDSDPGQRYSGFLDDILAREAVTQIQTLGEGKAPWFLNLWFYSPHAPITPPTDTATRYPDTLEGRYLAMVHRLDDNIGRVLKALEESGQARSTLVVFVSDNGAPTPFEASNTPFHGVKTTLHEGALRTPLIIRWPDGADAGRIDTSVARIYDIHPTVLARLGIALPAGLDGRDLAGPGAPAPEQYWEIFANGHYAYSVLHEGRWRLYKTWPWTPWERPPVLLDLAQEPGAPRDQAHQQPALLASLERSGRSWQRDVHRPRLEVVRDPSGAGMISGMDFLRTPGFGGFSFAIGVKPGYAGNLASQQGVWSLAMPSDTGDVIARFGEHELHGRTAEGECHSILASGWFGRRISSLPAARNRLRLALYIDGVKADSVEADGYIDDANFRAPTRVGSTTEADLNRLLTPPIILSSASDPQSVDWSPRELHDSLCSP